MVRVFKWSFLDAVRDPINFIEDNRFLPRLEADEQYFTQSFDSLYLFFCPRQLCSFFSHTPSITNDPPAPSHFLHSPSLGFHSEKVTPKKKIIYKFDYYWELQNRGFTASWTNFPWAKATGTLANESYNVMTQMYIYQTIFFV